MENVLVLSKAFTPVSIVSWQDAITLFYKEKVEIVSTYKDKFIHATNFTIEMPAIIRLLHFVRPNKHITIYKPFTRKNIYNRDNGICQFCAKHVSYTKFTIDHIIPKSAGGESNWKNCVCACVSCNSKKANKSLEEMKYKLIRPTFAPVICNSLEAYTISRMKEMKEVPHMDWKMYLSWLKDS